MAMVGWTWLTVFAIVATGVLHPAGATQTVHLIVCLLVFINILLGVALGVCWVSGSASLVLTETISSAICRPFAVIAELKIEVLHLVPSAPPDPGPRPPGAQAPPWVRQAVLASLLGSGHMTDASGLLAFLLYVLLGATEGHPALMQHPLVPLTTGTGMENSGGGQKKRLFSADRSQTQMAMVTVLLGILALLMMPLWQLCTSLFYCALTDTLFLREVSQLDFGSLHDAAAGQEAVVARGIFLLAEVGVSIAAIVRGVVHGHGLVLVSLLLNVLLPMRAVWWEVLEPLHRARQALWRFRKASWREILNYNDVCAICLSRMRRGRITPCHHLFHAKCLRRSLEEKEVCPMCNKDLALTESRAYVSMQQQG